MRNSTVVQVTVISVVVSTLLAAGCATVPCKPTPIVVAKKEERLRTELKTVGMRSTPTGGVEEIKRQEAVREYWVQAADKTWHKITEEQYEVAAPNVTIDLCR